jgi:lysophospholipid acyltransferase (LPLAT)-like uncharacterized protein
MTKGTNWRKDFKFFLLKKLIAPIYYFLFLYTKTLRFRLENVQIVLDWHQRIFCGFFLPRQYNLTIPVMISQNRDGDLVAGVVERSGFLPVRGSSSRGGREALRQMVSAVMEYGIGAHTLDGPTGPPRVVKAGLIAMAQRSGAMICPVYLIYEKYWIFNSWDRFMIPKPFSRVLISFSRTMETVPAYLDGPDFEAFRKKIEDQMIRTYYELDRYFEKLNRS